MSSNNIVSPNSANDGAQQIAKPTPPSALTKNKTKKSASVKTPGVLSQLQLKFQKDLTVTCDQQKTVYYLDWNSLITLADDLESVVRDQHRRGGHPAENSTAGMFFKFLAAKLQKVGVETNQIRVNNDCWIATEGLELPVCVSQVVSQFGLAHEGTGVEVFPLVTDSLVTYVNHTANCFLAGFGTAELRTIANHRGFFEFCYGEIDSQLIALRRLADRLEVNAVKLDSHDENGVIEMQTSILVAYHQANNNALPQNQLARLLADNVVGSIFLDGGAVPAADDLFPAPLIPHLRAVRTMHVNVANPFPIAALPGALTAEDAGLNAALQRSCMKQKRYLNSIYHCSAPAMSLTGTLAPIILVDVASRYVTASSFCFQCPPRDYIIAMSILGSTTVIVKDFYGTIFNIANSAQRHFPYETNKMNVSFTEAQVSVLDECIISKK